MNDYKIEVCSYYKPQTFDYSKKPNIKQLNYVTEYRFAGKGFLKFEDVDLDYCKESKLEVVGGIPVSEWRNIGTRKLADDSQREMIKKYVKDIYDMSVEDFEKLKVYGQCFPQHGAKAIVPLTMQEYKNLRYSRTRDEVQLKRMEDNAYIRNIEIICWDKIDPKTNADKTKLMFSKKYNLDKYLRPDLLPKVSKKDPLNIYRKYWYTVENLCA